MLRVIITIFALSLLLTVSVLGFQLYQGANMSQQAFELSQKVQEKKLDIRLQELKNEQQADAIEYRLTAARLTAKERLARSGMVARSRELGAATLYLWPILCVAAIAAGGILFAYSRRQTTIQEVEKARHSELIQTGEAAAKAVEKAMPNLVRAAIAAIPKPAQVLPPVEAIETPEPEALRAFTGNVHFSQAILDDDYDPDCVCMGRNVETGGLCQIPLDELQSLTVNGLQKQGKSVLLLSVIHAALTRKYVNQEPVKLVLVDIHAGLKESLLTRLESFLPGAQSLFDRVFDNEDVINDELPAYLDGLIVAGKTRSAAGITLLVFDEYTESVANLDEGKAIEARVKRLFNYRKAGIYLALAMFEAGKNSQSAKGLNVSKMAVSKALFHTAKDEGARFLPGGSEAATLDKGEFLLLLPGMAEPERIKAPLFAAMDFAPFAKYISQAALQLTGDDEVEDETTSISPDAVRDYIDKRKQEDPKFSQNKFAKESGINKGRLSLILNGKSEPTDAERLQLETTLQSGKTEDVIHLKHYRDRLKKQGKRCF